MSQAPSADRAVYLAHRFHHAIHKVHRLRDIAPLKTQRSFPHGMLHLREYPLHFSLTRHRLTVVLYGRGPFFGISGIWTIKTIESIHKILG